uniref:Uncharacterized protein n=1 Tax=Magallana gigas TaxID=29159 RepID=A0A8W8NJW4_MAGGI
MDPIGLLEKTVLRNPKWFHPKEKREASSTLSSVPVFLPHQSSRIPKLPIPAQYRGNPDSLKRNLQPILPRPHSFNSAMQTFALIPIQSMNQSQGEPKKDAENLPIMDKQIDHSKKKVVNIAPKFNSQNIVKQAWLNAQVGSDNECKSDTGIKEETSGDDSGVKRKKQNNGLPKPRIYQDLVHQKSNSPVENKNLFRRSVTCYKTVLMIMRMTM